MGIPPELSNPLRRKREFGFPGGKSVRRPGAEEEGALLGWCWRGFLIAAWMLVASAVGFAESLKLDPRATLEQIPPRLAAYLDTPRKVVNELSAGTEGRAVYSKLLLWPAGQRTLRVCFFSGPAATRSRVAAIASQWVEAGAVGLKLDFGDMDSPRLCDPHSSEASHIRISLTEEGYWSLLGQESVLVPQAEPSMSLQGLDEEEVSDTDFLNTVLHEFGHALGLEHEHQHPFESCEAEYNWEVIYDYLSGPPVFWERNYIDFAMRALHATEAEATPFDQRSVMLYSFPPEYYRQGERSRCYTEWNTTLSDGDRDAIRRLYPADPAVAAAAYEGARSRMLTHARSRELGRLSSSESMKILNRYLPPTPEDVGFKRN